MFLIKAEVGIQWAVPLVSYVYETPCRAMFKKFCLFLAQQPPVGQRLLIHEVSRSHTTMHQSR